MSIASIYTDIAHDRRDDAPDLPTRLKRIWFSLLLAVVLSAVEMQRRERFVEPTPIVMMIEAEPWRHQRRRPYRARYRYSSVTS